MKATQRRRQGFFWLHRSVRISHHLRHLHHHLQALKKCLQVHSGALSTSWQSCVAVVRADEQHDGGIFRSIFHEEHEKGNTVSLGDEPEPTLLLCYLGCERTVRFCLLKAEGLEALVGSPVNVRQIGKILGFWESYREDAVCLHGHPTTPGCCIK